jgi:ATP-dependent Clp protease adaptor protein ClpS
VDVQIVKGDRGGVQSRYNVRMPREPNQEPHHDHGVMLEPARPEVAPPPFYQVMLLNDDYTPMDFVVTVLQSFFAMDLDKATQVMLHVHTRGRGVCGVFTREVAESKVAQVNEFSRMNQHPLLCTMEKTSG